MVAAVLKNGFQAALFGLMAATLIAAAPAARADNTADKALLEALAKDEKEFKAALKEVPRSNVIGTVAKGPKGFYVTSLRPGHSLHADGPAADVSALADTGTTQGGQ